MSLGRFVLRAIFWSLYCWFAKDREDAKKGGLTQKESLRGYRSVKLPDEFLCQF